MKLNTIDEEYNKACFGFEKPTVIWLRCDNCKKTFTLELGKQNILCEHLKKIITLSDHVKRLLGETK